MNAPTSSGLMWAAAEEAPLLIRRQRTEDRRPPALDPTNDRRTALPLRGDEPGVTHESHVVARHRRRDVHRLGEVADAERAPAQMEQHPEPGRVSHGSGAG